MSNARNLARLLPNSSGLLPDSNIAGIAASKLSGILPTANLGAGVIIQTVPIITQSVVTINTSSPVQILSGSITVRQGSKIILISDTTWFSDQGASWNNAPSVGLYENGTLIALSEHQGVFSVSGAQSQNIPLNFATGLKNAGTYTYALKVNHVLGNTGGQVSRDSRPTTLTLMEIAQ